MVDNLKFFTIDPDAVYEEDAAALEEGAEDAEEQQLIA